MADTVINSNAQLLALQNRPVPDLNRVIKLVTLGDLASAPDMYQHLHSLVRANHWICEQLTVLEGFSCLALAVQSLRDDLEGLQPAMNPHAALLGPNSVLHTFARIKYEAGQLKESQIERDQKAALKKRKNATKRTRKEPAGEGGVGTLGTLLKGQSDQVLLGTMTIAEFQARIPEHLVLIDNLLHAGMQF